jgi:hypothetical protein
MCTTITDSRAIHGAGKGAKGWFPLTQVTVAFDHATHTGAEHALLLDFANYALGTDARVAVELDLASGRSLLKQLQAAIEAAETTGLREWTA